MRYCDVCQKVELSIMARDIQEIEKQVALLSQRGRAMLRVCQ